jgi:hypothetical protein
MDLCETPEDLQTNINTAMRDSETKIEELKSIVKDLDSLCKKILKNMNQKQNDVLFWHGFGILLSLSLSVYLHFTQ